MSARQTKRTSTATGSGTWDRMLDAVFLRNRAARVVREDDDGSVTLAVPTRRPAFLFPPISWVIRPPKERITVLDPVGALIWKLCDGSHTVEEIVKKFAVTHSLSFHESRVSVTTYSKTLLQRGVLAVAVSPESRIAP